MLVLSREPREKSSETSAAGRTGRVDILSSWHRLESEVGPECLLEGLKVSLREGRKSLSHGG